MAIDRPPSPTESVTSEGSFRSAQSSFQPPLPAGVDTENPSFTDSEIQALLAEAAELKEEGNTLFKSSQYEAAKEKYTLALRSVPKREQDVPIPSGQEDADDAGVPAYEPPPPPSEEEEQLEGEIVSPATAAAGPSSSPASPSAKPIPTDQTSKPRPGERPVQTEARLTRAVLHANIAACLLKLHDPKAAMNECSEALKDDPGYVKALHRRAMAGREVGSWSSLGTAQADLKKLLEILPPSSPLLPSIHTTLRALEPQLAAAAEREKSEMISKLKDLGNTFLGRFGLSTDNFQFVPDGKGGYGMSFQR